MNLRNLILSLLTLMLVSCLPQEKVTQCDSGETFNPSKRRCIASADLQSEGLSIYTFTPLTPFSYTYGQYFAPKTFNVTIKDPNGVGYASKWEIFGTSSTTTVSYSNNFTLSSSYINSPGTYTLLYTLSTTSGNTVDTKAWTIQASSSSGATIISPSPLTQTILRYSNNTANQSFSIDYTNPLTESVTLKWYLDGTEYTSISTNFGKNIIFPASLFAIPGTYTVEVALTGSLGSSDLRIWTVNVSHPSLPIITSVSEPVGTTHLLIDSLAYGNNFCVTFNSLTHAPSGVQVSFYETGALKQQTTINHPTLNECYTPTVSLMHPQIGESRILEVKAIDIATGLDITSSIAPSISWNLVIRPKNEAPTAHFAQDKPLDEVQCGTVGATIKQNCEIYLNEPNYFTFQINDSDYDFTYANGVPTDPTNTDKYQVQYFVDGAPYTCPNVNGSIGIQSSDKFSCLITLNSYDSNGPIIPDKTHYTVTAVVTDSSMYSLPAFPGLTSNTITWDIDTVQINNNVTVINPQGIASTSSQLKDSIGTVLDTTTAGISENQILYFHLKLTDFERDNGVVTITRCANSSCTIFPPGVEPSVSQTLHRTDANNPALLKVPYYLRDDVVTGALTSDVYFLINYSDARLGISSPEIMSLKVNDINPPPALAEATSVNPTPNMGAATGVDTLQTYYVYPSFPFTINPGSITDSSQYDGDEIIYEWQYSDDNINYYPIEGGDTHTLIYTPPKTAAGDIYINLCVRDNGVDHGDQPKCTKADKNYYWKLNVLNPEVFLASPYAVDGEKAIFFDEADNVLYSAYASTENIYLNKIVYDKENAPVHDTQEITIKAFEASTGCSPHNLSLTGHNHGTSKTTLYLAYLCDDSFGPGAITKLNIRQINVFKEKTYFADSGTFGFHYQGWTNPSALTVDPSMSLSTVNHRREISINTVIDGDKITFYGLSTKIIKLGADICNPITNCPTTAAAAEELKNYINDSDSLTLQGTYAQRVSNKVTLWGVIEDNIYESPTHVRTIGKIKIIKDGGGLPHWYIPIQKANPTQVSVLQGQVMDYLPDSPLSENVINLSNEGFEIDNETSINNQYLIAIKTPDNKVDFYYTNFNGFAAGTYNADLFAPKLAFDIRIAKTTNGANISARDTSNPSEILVAHSENDYTFSSVSNEPILATSSLQTLFAKNNDYAIKSIDDAHVAIVFSTIADASPEAENLYVGKISFDSMNSPILTCSGTDLQTCPVIGSNIPVTAQVVMDDIVLKELGTSGATANENQRLTLPLFYNDNSNNIFHNLINVSDETITTTGQTYSSMPYLKGTP